MLHIACLNKLILSGNELCGLWKEHVAGEYRILGSYTTFAVDALIDGLRRHRVTLHRDGVKVDGNLMRPSDEKRIQQALIENERIPKKNAAAVALALATIGAANTAGLFGMESRANNNGTSAVINADAKSRLDQWFNTSVFSQPAAFTLGNVGTLVPDLRAHHTNNLDFSLFKQVSLSEKFRLQFRAESFNTANRVQFSGPNSNVNGGAAFGRVTAQANQPRQLQFGLKLLF
jgi:hypothetical protein